MDDNGEFVIAWSSYTQDGSSYGIYAKRYNASGVAQGSEFRVNTFTTSPQVQAAVAMDTSGDFVVAWTSYNQDGSNGGVYAQRYSAAGLPLGSEFRANSYTTNKQAHSSVAIDANGDFVIAWDSSAQDGSLEGIYAQRYDAAGIAQDGEFRVNTYATNFQVFPSVAMDGSGDFVVTWASNNQDGSGTGIYAQQYAVTGVAQGSEFRVNTFTSSNQFLSTVAMDRDGDFVTAWDSDTQDGSGLGIYAQRYVVQRTPTVGSLADSPDPLPEGDPLTLSASNVTDDGTITSVSFYRESNGVAGLQVGLQGDTLVGTANAHIGNVWSVNVPTSGLAPGTYTYWAQATDDLGLIGTPASTTNTVAAAAPAVTSSSFNFATLPQRLSFTFNQNVGPSLDLGDIVVQQLPGGPTITPSSLSYNAGTNTATFNFNAPLPDGRFRARLIGSGISGPGGQLPADHLFEFTFLRGDANGDGRVNLNDFNILAANFGQSPRDFTQGDFDYSGNVNLNDFNILASRFGVIVAPAGSFDRSPFSRIPVAAAGKSAQARRLVELLNEQLG
jgi:hypothetical protein